MARSRKRTEINTESADTETLPPGATDFDPAALEAQTQTAQAEQNGHSEAEQNGGHAAGVILNPSSVRREAEGEQSWVQRANVITDAVAKMKFHFDYERHKAAITFDEGKPSDPVRQALKDAGFRWNPDMAAWETPVRFSSRAEDRQRAVKVFNEVAGMVRDEKAGAGQAEGYAGRIEQERVQPAEGMAAG